MDQENYDEEENVTMEVEQTSTKIIKTEIQIQVTPQQPLNTIPILQQQQTMMSLDAMRLRASLAQRSMGNPSVSFSPNIPSSLNSFASQGAVPPQQSQPAPPAFPSSIPLPVQHAIHDRAKLVELEEDKAFIDLLQELESFEPIIPDQLTDYFMMKAGLDCSDIKSKRLISLIAQKYVTDIAQDAVQYCKIRTNATGTTGPSAASASTKDASGSSKKTGTTNKEKKLVLSMDDLSCSLSDYGIALKKPSNFR